ncbi:MAG: KTSC domain-containing protein [Candidatus Omnitrophota bacterium]
MNRKHIVSSNISSIGYDVNNKILEIEFKNGSIYQYFNVPSNVFDKLMSVSSQGNYFYHNIKNTYDYKHFV